MTAYARHYPDELLPAGTPAPDFTLHATPDQTLSLSELGAESRSSWSSTPRTGARSAATS